MYRGPFWGAWLSVLLVGCGAASDLAPPPGQPESEDGAEGEDVDRAASRDATSTSDEPEAAEGAAGASAFDPSDPSRSGASPDQAGQSAQAEPDRADDARPVNPVTAETAEDRCLGAGCAEVALPDQPELAFLEEVEPGWLRLLEADWVLSPNSEGYRCVRFTVPKTIFITAFYPVGPEGTHHSTVTASQTPSGPDGVTSCGVGNTGERRLQGAGAGTDPVELPEGVAMRVEAGEQLLMNLHLFNPTNSMLSGRSGVLVKLTDPESVEHEADVTLAGPLTLSIPPGEVVQTGQCTFGSEGSIFSVGPHMHQLGVHMRVVAHSSIVGEQVLHDAPFDFYDQRIYPIPMAAGDRVSLECTYQNDTDQSVGWGDSSLDEMCFVSLARYPISGETLCLN